ncbi:hypothetical protein K523DRAFT_288650 [Schizophyllum commune Tattone D]|nr:hypothetical protein K523DRAFT_288650 [Schizophyllum commune Tattone D]
MGMCRCEASIKGGVVQSSTCPSTQRDRAHFRRDQASVAHSGCTSRNRHAVPGLASVRPCSATQLHP